MIKDRSHTSRFQGTLKPLTVPAYRRLLGSNAIWDQAMTMEVILTGWLVFELTDSAWAVSFTSFWRRASQLMFGFFAGPVVDRLGRRNAIILAQLFSAIVYIVLITLLFNDSMSA